MIRVNWTRPASPAADRYDRRGPDRRNLDLDLVAQRILEEEFRVNQALADVIEAEAAFGPPPLGQRYDD